ncbi:acetyl-CoA:acetoacetyl-CoA transferase subunit alpha [Chelatococcus asaccharovorans]|uniref:3-oxoacid CoA-transferase subunit A n=1 Tax=Chelatococcus asaccharovorans TaxID=28210 RepID=UPI00224C78F0|nr:3-oxoacid CoA-transferase subunit A [Chelatococcus asaccharovorans]CAH1661319.1 acetyl-CoA:acetoacetyl-CoA transferase subunit alpha [Chelatococcus asaccharovorans]CAH1683511.1 acetyl-CoA:acetoacetyl-CoA transferase subunit alpha [Chelatococcus asaccharovorans]
MINKQVARAAEALADVRDGSTILVGGFGQIGHPMALIDGLIEQGARDLVIVCNNAGVGTSGLPRLMKLGRVAKIICSYPRTAAVFTELYAAGKLELEITPQGTLAERIRAAGAGIGGFYTRTSAGTLLAAGKETREIDGVAYVFEKPLKGDVAIIEAWEGDRWGNLTYRGSGQNFNPVMATAAALTVAQVQRVVELGAIDPEDIVTPSIFVDRVVEIPYEPPYPAISY